MPRNSSTAVDVVKTVAEALIFTHHHHGFEIGERQGDGWTPVKTFGRGEYQDHHWLIADDGTVQHA